MKLFANAKMSLNIAGMLGALGLVALLATGFAVLRMRAIDAGYQSLLDGPSKAALALARADRGLVFVERALYEATSATDNAANANATRNMKAGTDAFHSRMAAARAAMPAEAPAMDAIGECARTYTLEDLRRLVAESRFAGCPVRIGPELIGVEMRLTKSAG
jgi:methyl-accepting chemotaxis protein